MALLTVGVADCRVSDDPGDILVADALGSCIAVLLYDPVARVAGLLHFMLPDSSIDSTKANRQPYMFADTGLPLLLHKAAELGAIRSRMAFMAVGGASMLHQNGLFNVGQRNHHALATIFHQAGITLNAQDIGGSSSRSLRIEVAGGRVRIRKPGSDEEDLVECLGNAAGIDAFQHLPRG